MSRTPDGEALVTEALDLALALEHPVQDCVYLALALRSDARILTADRIFADAIRRHGVHRERVMLLGEASL